MAFEITQRARDLTQNGVIEPQMVLEIDGETTLFTSAVIEELATYGNSTIFYGKPGLVYGGLTEVDNQADLISLDGTTTNITQQLIQDQGLASSTSNVTVSIVNKDNQYGYLLRPQGLNDILSKKATLYLGLKGGSFPEDFVRLFVANITEVTSTAGKINFLLSHPENVKRGDLFTQVQTELAGSITNSQSTITLLSTQGLLLPADLLSTYVRIEDELIQYTGISGNNITGCTRGVLNTIAASHDIEASVTSFYKLGDGTAESNAIDLALKVMLSGAINTTQIPVAFFIRNAFITPNLKYVAFSDRNLAEKLNIRVGDTFTVTGAVNPSNNSTFTINRIQVTDLNTLLHVDEFLVTEYNATATAVFNSQYATLPVGIGLTPDQVDIDEFLRVKELFLSSLPFYEFYIKDTTSGKELLNKEILFPAACYSLPRKGRVSVGKTKPPIAEFETKKLDASNILNASDLKTERSTLKDFYNAVVFKYNEDSIEDKFLSGRVTLSTDSTNRIKSQTKAYLVTSKGMRKSDDNETVITNNSRRILDRYQFGAESINGIRLPFSVGWNIEVGDALIIEGLQLLDSKTGEKELDARVVEVTNRAFNFRTGVITINVTDTAFSIDGRYGVVSPSSICDTGSTTTRLVLTKANFTPANQRERDKWDSFIGEKVLVRTPDFTQTGETTIQGFDASNDFIMIVDPALSFAPPADAIIELANYDTASALQKTAHVYLNPQTLVTANSANQTTFETDTPERFFVGAVVQVHDFAYTRTSLEALVTNITGSTITVDRDLGFNPQDEDEVDLIGFSSDQGLPYRIL